VKTPSVSLVVSIDTEEDNWEPVRSGITVENIRAIPELDRFFGRLGVRATYFTTYQVAITPWAADLLAGIAACNRAEVGAHLHPWNTPPLEEPFVPRNTVTMNLPASLQAAKIRSLTAALGAVLDQRPVSFRAGRWGFGAATGAALLACGYRVDSSVTPFMSWDRLEGGASHLGAPMDIYSLDPSVDPYRPVAGGPLAEVPISSGYSRLPWSVWSRVHRLLNHRSVHRLRLAGIASRLGIIRHITLCPELDNEADMLALARLLIEQGVGHLHLTWHSTSLRPGLSPLAASAADVKRLYSTVESFVEGLAGMATVLFTTVSEAAGLTRSV
jgi:peptidoglycan/xylan/chitin deacetylase (PgdA/CDA1 family)